MLELKITLYKQAQWVYSVCRWEDEMWAENSGLSNGAEFEG